MINIQLSENPLSLDKIKAFLSDESCGGFVHFEGKVRNTNKNEIVKHLVFEAFEPMALKEMKKIAENAISKFEISKIALHHRLGKCAIGEDAVLIGVASKHRKDAFLACAYAIDTLKETVPIFKKEFLENGVVWINAHP